MEININRTLIELHNNIMSSLQAVQNDRNFNELLTNLMSDINDLSDNRLDARVIINRMLARLNENQDNEFDTRWTSPHFQIGMPIAMSQRDLVLFVEVMRKQVSVWNATGINLDSLGIDFDFSRFEATRAIRQGFTWNQHGDLFDFPIGSRLQTRDSGMSPLIFEIYQTNGGHVLFRHIPTDDPFIWGDVANTYFGDLSQASPINSFGRATITDQYGAYIPGQNRETDEQYRRRFLSFLRRKAFGGNVVQYMQEVVQINGVSGVMIFPVWRGEGTVKISIVNNNMPVSEDFTKIVKEIIDPSENSGAGMSMWKP